MQDRIKQMAVEAGFTLHSFNAIDDDEVMAGEYVITDDLARFARLVAEDCATHIERKMTEGRSPMGKVTADFIRARYAETKEG